MFCKLPKDVILRSPSVTYSNLGFLLKHENYTNFNRLNIYVISYALVLMLKRRLKIITDIHCDVLLDNLKIGTVRPNKLTIFNVNKGEYLLTLVAVNNKV